MIKGILAAAALLGLAPGVQATTIFDVQPGEVWQLTHARGMASSILCLTPGCSFTAQSFGAQFNSDFTFSFGPRTCGFAEIGSPPYYFINAGFTRGGSCDFTGFNLDPTQDLFLTYSILSSFNGTFQIAAQDYGNPIATRISSVPLPAALPLLGAALAGLGFMGWWRRRSEVAP